MAASSSVQTSPGVVLQAPANAQSPDLGSRAAFMLVALLTLVATVVRVHLLAQQSIWIDEATSITLAKMAWWPFLRVLWGYQGNMSL
jgi:hypothetical protein